MANSPWTNDENDLIVEDHFAMLADDIARRAYNKAAHRRELIKLLPDRSKGSLEFKHQNISAALISHGQPWIDGYKPRYNFQDSLVEAVDRWLAKHPDWVSHITPVLSAPVLNEPQQIRVEQPPTLKNQPPPEELEQTLRVARKFDVAGRDERNRALGRAGEELVLAHEKSVLRG